jgi:hypothetical protein
MLSLRVGLDWREDSRRQLGRTASVGQLEQGVDVRAAVTGQGMREPTRKACAHEEPTAPGRDRGELGAGAIAV